MNGPYRTPDPPPPHKHRWKLEFVPVDDNDGLHISDPNHEFYVRPYLWCTECGESDESTLTLLKYLPVVVFNSFLIKK